MIATMLLAVLLPTCSGSTDSEDGESLDGDGVDGDKSEFATDLAGALELVSPHCLPFLLPGLEKDTCQKAYQLDECQFAKTHDDVDFTWSLYTNNEMPDGEGVIRLSDKEVHQRAECIIQLGQALGIADFRILFGGSTVKCTSANPHEIEPLLLLDTVDKFHVSCNSLEGACNCDPLTVAECQMHPFCMKLQAHPLDNEAQCFKNEKEAVGCAWHDSICFGLEVDMDPYQCAIDPDGNYYWIKVCLPGLEGWRWDDEDACSEFNFCAIE